MGGLGVLDGIRVFDGGRRRMRTVGMCVCKYVCNVKVCQG